MTAGLQQCIRRKGLEMKIPRHTNWCHSHCSITRLKRLRHVMIHCNFIWHMSLCFVWFYSKIMNTGSGVSLGKYAWRWPVKLKIYRIVGWKCRFIPSKSLILRHQSCSIWCVLLSSNQEWPLSVLLMNWKMTHKIILLINTILRHRVNTSFFPGYKSNEFLLVSAWIISYLT